MEPGAENGKQYHEISHGYYCSELDLLSESSCLQQFFDWSFSFFRI